MSHIEKIRSSIVIGTAAAVMLSGMLFTQLDRSLFFPSFVLSACCEQNDEGEVEYGFALFDFFRSLFS